jgi:hypothetical protein
MRKHLLLLLTGALALAGLSGCSSDQSAAPTRSGATLWSVSKNLGPSEIVLALDVSDAVSAADLAAMITAAEAALTDDDLVPDDGSIAVAAVVYGDTIAVPFAGLVAVTPDNLQNVILPALAGLNTDRLVTGATADLAGAMEAAGIALAGGSVADQHLLVMGSGAAADTAAVGTAGAALAGAGAMVSAIIVGEGAPLAAVVASTEGYFHGMTTDLTATTAEALAYMLQADLALTGSATELARGAEFTATATFFRGGDDATWPLLGREVAFTVISGPNAGGPFAALTDTAGHAKVSYLGLGGPGLDTVVAAATHPGTGVALTDTVTVNWLNALPSCDIGGPYGAVVEGDTVRVMLAATAADADGDTLTFHWVLGCEGGSFDDVHSATPVLTLTGDCLCVEGLSVTLHVSDGFDTTMCEAPITLDDQRPPVVEVIQEPLMLWSPNHKYTAYTPEHFIVRAEDACGDPIDLSTVEVLSVTSDEPDDATGDGRTVNDIMVTCPGTVKLRAERMGGGDGRVYTIVYRVFADNGEFLDVTGKVVVPHDSSSRPAGEDPTGGFTVVPDCGDDD